MALAPTVKFQHDAKVIVDLFADLRWRALNTYEIYWKTSANSDIGALASGSTPASFASRLTKNQCQSQGLVIADQLGNNFFENSAVTTGDYMTSIQSLLHGNATATLVSVPAEDFANEAKGLAADCLSLFSKCRDAENFYSAQGIASLISGLSGTDLVTPDGVTKDELTAALVLMQQYQNFVNNAAVTTAAYKTTLGLWARY